MSIPTKYTEVNPTLWRGPRPELEDFGSISQYFHTVISLEGAEEDAKEVMDLKPSIVESYPISPWEIYIAGITQEKLKGILFAVFTATGPTLLHCQHGEDRTGLIIAAYRVEYQGWTKQAAWLEALKFGYRHWINFGLNNTWKSFTK